MKHVWYKPKQGEKRIQRACVYSVASRPEHKLVHTSILPSDSARMNDGGTRTASSSRCVHSVKPTTKRSKKLAPPHPDLACSIDLKRLRNKESRYDRKQATVPEKPKLLSCMLAIAKRQRQELRMNTTISILVANSAKVKYKAGREFAVGSPQAC